MGRHWTEHKYISVDNLWSFIDEQISRLDLLGQNDSVESSELCKLLMLGRREMLDAFCAYLSDNETHLREIVVDTGVLTEEQVKKSIKEEYGI